MSRLNDRDRPAHGPDQRVMRLHLREHTLTQQRATAVQAGDEAHAATLTWLLRLVRTARARCEQSA